MNLDQAIGFRKQVNMHQPDDSLPLPSELMGVELEYENIQPMLLDSHPPLWVSVSDGSLRNGREYVFSEPLYGTGIIKALNNMTEFIEETDPKVTERCSVHVHINVSDMSVDQFLTLIVLYLIFEKSIIKYHGGHREDNIFCIPYYKAPEPLALLVEMYSSTIRGDALDGYTIKNIIGSFEKYYGLNIGAVVHHGSLEFRHMAGTTDMSDVLNWISIIQCLKKAALSKDVDYMKLINEMSGNTSTIVEEIFKEYSSLIMYPNMTTDLISGARLAQKVVGGMYINQASDIEVRRRHNNKTSNKIKGLKEKIRGSLGDVGENGIKLKPFDRVEIAPPLNTVDPSLYNMREFMHMINEQEQAERGEE